MAKTHITKRHMDELLQVRCTPEFLARLDDWRRLQPDLPSRAEAIRRIVSDRIVKDVLAVSGARK